MAQARRGLEAARALMRGLAERLSLPAFESWSTTIRTVFLNLLFLVMVVILVPLLIGQFRRDQVIIEPIAVPESLATQGLTPEVAASRIWDGLLDVRAAAGTAKESITALPDSRRVEFSFPDSGFSIESLVFHLRKLFNAYETRIAGEFVCSDSVCAREGMRLRLRIVRDRVDLVDLPPVGAMPERDYFTDAAAGVMSVLDPFVAIAALAKDEPLRATILARRLIRGRHRDAKWAHNLIGNIRSDAADYPAAITEYRAALELDLDFSLARANLGNVLRLTGDLKGARAEFDRIAANDPGDVRMMEGYADIALAEGKAAEAVARLVEAAERDPLSPRYLARAGTIEMEAGNTDAGEALLKRALEIDPGYLPAFAMLAATHVAKGDFSKAEPIYRDAADYAPDDANAQMSHGRILAILKRCEQALPRFTRAVALDASSADYRLQKAQCEQSLGRHDDAITTIKAAIALAPANADLHIALANSYRDTDRKAEAVAEYRKYLELDKDGVMRPIAERFITLLSE